MFTYSISGSEVRLPVRMIAESEIKNSVSHSKFSTNCVTFLEKTCVELMVRQRLHLGALGRSSWRSSTVIVSPGRLELSCEESEKSQHDEF